MIQLSRRAVLRALQGVAAGAFLDACGGGGSGTPVLNSQPRPSGSFAPVSVKVSSTAAGSIEPSFIGLSYEKAAMSLPLFTPANDDLIGLFGTLGPGVLRIGGNSVNQTLWQGPGPGLVAKQVATSDIDRLAGFITATGWEVLYGVNFATSTPALAAAEIVYAVQALGSSLIGVEFGNEPDEYSGHYFPATYSLADFETGWSEFQAAVLKLVPGVKLTGPACAVSIDTWTVPFGPEVRQESVASDATLLPWEWAKCEFHGAELLLPDAKLQQDLVELAAGAKGIGLPFRITETNSYYNGGASGVSDSYASALWVIDDLFAMALGGAQGLNLHGGGDSAGYTPIADLNGVVVGARPEYYGMLLFLMAGTGTLRATTVQAAGYNVSAYTISGEDGALALIILNKELKQGVAVTVDCGQTVNSTELYVMTGPSLQATTGVTIQGASVGVDGSFQSGEPYAASVQGATLSCYVGALAAVLIRVT